MSQDLFIVIRHDYEEDAGSCYRARSTVPLEECWATLEEAEEVLYQYRIEFVEEVIADSEDGGYGATAIKKWLTDYFIDAVKIQALVEAWGLKSTNIRDWEDEILDHYDASEGALTKEEVESLAAIYDFGEIHTIKVGDLKTWLERHGVT